ncbi:hypothetical protein [Noviherbaspirillum denitrificans]|uniref:Uncharacterized protein n=1 Tax=Noviherbaspirillum denitrificans TaxID=1968433 RepID=A0A254TES6_9BURK|nr:hypothetical protein [Noviherbaspirillum denitrificans]OWW18168.1 hypothetical protein AYR66_02050 [Noviherbaspirillum denitrificans]
MWKIFVGFIAFALLALFVIMKGGDKVDMQGEAGHGTPSASEHASAPAASAPAAPAAAPAASEPAAAAPAAPAAAPAESSAPAAGAPAASK